MQNENSRNTIIFMVCAALMFLFYQHFVLDPARERQLAQRRQAAASAPHVAGTPAAADPLSATPVTMTREQAIASGGPRIQIRTPTLSGSIALRGARFDDLSLTQYHETTDPASPAVELLRPSRAEYAYFADFGWSGQNLPGLPDADTLWTAPAGAVLTPQTPVTLTYVNATGLTFTHTIAVDANYMFTITDVVANRSGQNIAYLRPAARVMREGLPERLGHNSIVHEGAIGVFGDQLQQAKYPSHQPGHDWGRFDPRTYSASGGWLGITDQYWMAAMVPANGVPFTGQFQAANGIFAVRYDGQAQPLSNGRQRTTVMRFYAGAKQVPLLGRYERGEIASPGVGDARIARFHDAVDWGHFAVITQPVFWLLDQINRFLGDFGLAILALTVIVKLVFFPLANKSYESLTKMKKVQPQLEALREQYKDDPAGQQKEMMAIYQREKINPLMGCLPVFVQIPVFFSLYKVLTVTIEMRHAPFFGMIDDLSGRDPTTFWNLFGLLPYNPATLPVVGGLLDANLHVGIFAIVYGFTMWLSQAMAPQTGMDPMQKRIFAFMPLIFTFALSQLAVGLMIYYTWNNVLSILQQYVIMRRYKVENPIDDIIARLSGRQPKAAE